MTAPEPREDVAVAEVLAAAVHRLKFPDHGDCEANPVEVRDARLHLEALAPLIRKERRSAAVEAWDEAFDLFVSNPTDPGVAEWKRRANPYRADRRAEG